MTESYARHILRLAVRAGAAAAILAMAACSDGKETEAAAPETPATPAAAPEATANAAGLPNCATPTDGKVHFRVAGTTLAVPGNIVLDAIPAGMQPPITKERVVAEVKAKTDQGIGCPGKPLDAGLLLIKDNLNHPLLDGNMGILALPPGGITKQFAAETQRLQDSPTKACRPITDTDLMACAGTEKRGDTVTEVLYVITTDKTQKMASGGPLAARCVRQGQKIAGCNLVDQLPGGLAIDASLKSGTYSTSGLRGALDTAMARVNAMRM